MMCRRVAAKFLGIALMLSMVGCGQRDLTHSSALADATAELARGVAACDAGNYAEAVAAFDAAQQRGHLSVDDWVLLYQKRAAAHLQLGDLDKAMADISKAMEVDEGPDSLKIRAEIYQKQGETAKAKADWLAAQKGDPSLRRAAAHR